MRRRQGLKWALLNAPVWTPPEVLEDDRTVPLLAPRKDSSGPSNTAGSLITGGRYNAPKGLPGAHEMLSLDEKTAVAHAEARAINVVAGPPGIVIGPGPDQRPRLDITVKLRLGAVLDLTDASVEAHLELQGRTPTTVAAAER